MGTVGVTRRDVHSSATPTKLTGAGNLAKARLKKLWSQGGIKVDQLFIMIRVSTKQDLAKLRLEQLGSQGE